MRNSKYHPAGSTGGRARTDQSPSTFDSRDSSQLTLRCNAVAVAGTPASLKAIVAIAVSHTGDRHGSSRSVSPSRIDSFSSSSSCDSTSSESVACPRHFSTTIVQIIGGKIAPSPSLSSSRSSIHRVARLTATPRSGFNPTPSTRLISQSIRRNTRPQFTQRGDLSRSTTADSPIVTGNAAGLVRNSSSICWSAGSRTQGRNAHIRLKGTRIVRDHADIS